MSALEYLTPEEEEVLLARQRRRNRWLMAGLWLFVIAVIVFTMVMIARTGFVPLDDTDLFRST